MKRLYFLLFVLTIAVYALPSYVIAADNNYITLKPGIYSPQSNSLKHFDTGFNGEIAFGHRFNPNVAIEAGIGHFNTEATFRYPFRANIHYNVVPITLSGKLIWPADKWEFFGVGGLGAYIISMDTKVSGTINSWSGRASFKDADTVFGAHLGLGCQYNITPKLFVGAEGKYLWARPARLRDHTRGITFDARPRMDGVLATAVMGFRF